MVNSSTMDKEGFKEAVPDERKGSNLFTPLFSPDPLLLLVNHIRETEVGHLGEQQMPHARRLPTIANFSRYESALVGIEFPIS